MIKISFKEKCPHCKRQNTVKERKVVCDSCGEEWDSVIYTNEEPKEPRAFEDSPTPDNNDRRIRSSNWYKLFKEL